jgi:hypothetical protein
MKPSGLSKKEIVKCPVCGKKVETVICNGVQKYFDMSGDYHECYRKGMK